MTIDIAKLRELLAAATPGPWFGSYSAIFSEPAQRVYDAEDSKLSLPDPRVAFVPASYGDTPGPQAVADAELVVALRNAAEELLSDLESERAKVRVLREAVEAFVGIIDRAEQNADNDGKGMQVPYLDDFAMLKQMPSVRRELRFWARRFREALAATKEPE